MLAGVSNLWDELPARFARPLTVRQKKWPAATWTSRQLLARNVSLPAFLGHISARRRMLLRNSAPGDRRRGSRGTFALWIRRQTRLRRGVKDILVTGITVTTLLTSVATASAQNFFEALFGRMAAWLRSACSVSREALPDAVVRDAVAVIAAPTAATAVRANKSSKAIFVRAI